jgi:TRAP transporter TAXI family solute receptor
MARGTPGLSALTGALLAVLAAGSALLLRGEDTVPRVSFVIATGPTGATYFPVGEAIAAIVSHPPGVYRCETSGVCGPSGLIASVRTSPGAVFNVQAVSAHTVDAALAQSDVLAEAVAGRGAFKSAGGQKHVRILADLFPEEVHLLATRDAHISSVVGLKGKHVSIGANDSGTIVTARAVLAAFRVPMSRMKVSNDSSDIAAVELSQGKLDAMFFVGGAPVPLVRELLDTGKAMLVPIDGDGRTRLLKQSHGLVAASIPAGLYPKTGKTETVAVRAILIVNDSLPNGEVYAIARSLFNPANRGMLAGSHRSAQTIRLDTAAIDLPAPLHPGAMRFYAEAGKLPKKPPAKSNKP